VGIDWLALFIWKYGLPIMITYNLFEGNKMQNNAFLS